MDSDILKFILISEPCREITNKYPNCTWLLKETEKNQNLIVHMKCKIKLQ